MRWIPSPCGAFFWGAAVKGGIGMGLQAWQVREAVRRFGPGSVAALAARTLIPRDVFHRRLIELERLGFVARNPDGRFRSAGELSPGSQPVMTWHLVDGSTFESLTHRIRRIVEPDPHWRAERKEMADEPHAMLPGHFPDAITAQRACEADEYARASGR